MDTIVVLQTHCTYSRYFRCLSCVSLVILGLVSLVCGVGRTLTCGHFFNLAVDFWNGFALLVAAVYVAMIDWPREFTAKLILYFLFFNGFVVFGISVLSLLLEIGESSLPIELTAILIGRSFHAVEGCRRLFEDFTEGWKASSQNQKLVEKHIRFIRLISYCLSGTVGFLQIIVSCTIIQRLKHVFRSCKFKSPHVHIVLGFVCIIAGSVHLIYCSRYYYVALGIVSGAFFVSTGLYHANCRFPYKTVLLILNGITFCLSGCLVPVSALGFVCWLPKGYRPSFTPLSSTRAVTTTSIPQSFTLDRPQHHQSGTSHHTTPPNPAFHWSRNAYLENLACIEEKDNYFKLARLADGDLYVKCLRGLHLMGYWSDTSPTYYQFAWIHLQYIQMLSCAILVVAGAVEFVFSIINLIVIFCSDLY